MQRRVRIASLNSSIDEVVGLSMAVEMAAEEEGLRRGGRKLKDFLKRVRSFRQRDIWLVELFEGDIFFEKMGAFLLGA